MWPPIVIVVVACIFITISDQRGLSISSIQRQIPELCERNLDLAPMMNKTCIKQCKTDHDCKSKKKRCICDGVCGLSCLKPSYCGVPPKLPNARHDAPINKESFSVDVAVEYTCYAGYETKGFRKAKCILFNRTSKWFGPDLICEPVSCGDPGQLDNGSRNMTAQTFTGNVAYSCNAGYIMEGRRDRFCHATGQWSGSLPVCRPISCDMPFNPPNGKAIYSSTLYKEMVAYKCDYGYRLGGDKTRICDAHGKWSGQMPFCAEIDCGSLGELYNGYYDEDSTAFNTVVIFHCHKSMAFQGNHTSVCLENGKWSSPLPQCLAPCVVPPILNGNAREVEPGTTIDHGNSIEVTCSQQHELEYGMSNESICHNGTWLDLPKCIPERCKTLPKHPLNGFVIAPKTNHGMKARYRCKDGFRLSGLHTTKCHYGNWTSPTPNCTVVLCRFPGLIENGDVLLVGHLGLYDYSPYVQKIRNGRQIVFECSKGFRRSQGPSGSTCIGGFWRPKRLPKCVPDKHPQLRWIRSLSERYRTKRTAVRSETRRRRHKNKRSRNNRDQSGRRRSRKGHRRRRNKCPPLRKTDIMMIIGPGPNGTNKFTSGELKIICEAGYGVNVGNKTVKCVRGKWKPKMPTCTPLSCKVPAANNGAYYTEGKELTENNPIVHEKTITFSCKLGYKMHGEDSIGCWYGEWLVDSLPYCTPDTCELPEIINGRYTDGYSRGLPVAHGSKLTYECNEDFVQETSRTLECNVGILKPSTPSCIKTDEIMTSKVDVRADSEKLASSTKGNVSIVHLTSDNFYRPCGPPHMVDNTMMFTQNEEINSELTEQVFPHSTKITFRCIVGITRNRRTWVITCDQGTWIGAEQSCDEETFDLQNKSCQFRNTEPNLIAFNGDKMITEDVTEFPAKTKLVFRCKDIGKFNMIGSIRRNCINGQWDGIKPSCFGLSQENDYALEKPPTILFRHQLGPIAQTNDGKLMVYPGTILHLECLWIRKYGKPRWAVSHTHRRYPEDWATGSERDPNLEYRLSIYHAQQDDSGKFICITPMGYKNSVTIEVKAVHCAVIEKTPRLIISNPSTKMNAKVSFRCESNETRLQGVDKIKCLPSGRWSDDIPSCKAPECPEMVNVTSGKLRMNTVQTEIGMKLEFSCDSGYILQGPKEYRCVTNNQWTLPFPTCHAPNCPEMNNISDGNLLMNTERDKSGMILQFSCKPGHVLRGPEKAACLANDQWDRPFPTCIEVRCPKPKTPINGFAQSNNNRYYKASDIVMYTCNEGYMMEGLSIIVCQDNGMWSGSAPKCVRACTYPGITVGGSISVVKFYYKINENITFDCAEGMQLQGPRMLRCLPSGHWSSAIPQCIVP